MAAAGPAAADADAFERAWARHLEAERALPLQPGCLPQRTDPPPRASLRGTVVWLHGFSACPQQFAELADALAAAGWRSLALRLPGHGLVDADSGEPDLSRLPTAGDWRATYARWADALHALVAPAAGERVIAGLSSGAVAALFAQQQRRGLFDRQLLLAPYFAPALGPLGLGLLELGGRLPLLRRLPAGLFTSPEPCLEEMARGRAGFCRYRLAHATALSAMGSAVLDALAQVPLAVRTQVVGVADDAVAHNGLVLRLLELQATAPGAAADACFLPPGVPHAFVSPRDNPGLEMRWLPPLTRGVLAFVDDGLALPTAGELRVAGQPQPRCALPPDAAPGRG